MPNEFQVLIQAIVDAKDVQTRLNAIKDLSVKIEKVNLDPSAIESLRNQLSRNGIDINLVLGNINQIQTEATKAGQQIGKQIQTGIDSIVQKGNFKKVFGSVVGDLNNTGKEAEKYFQSLSDTVSIQEKLGKNNNLESFVVSLKNADGVAEQLRYTLKQIEDDNGNITNRWFEYTGGSINDNGVIRQFNAISNAADILQIKVEKLKANYSDLNAPKAIKDSDHLSSLDQQYDKILQSVSELRSADNSTFTSMQTNVKSEISALESMIQQYKNAEYAATSLRTKDITTIKIDEGNNLDTFVQKMEQSGHYTEALKAKVLTLKTDLSNVFDSNSLTAYLNKLSNLQSEFKSIDATAKTLEKSTKLQVNIDSERSILTSYENEIKESGVLTEDLKQKIKTLYDSLGTITTQTGLTTWRAELKGVKSEIDDVIRTSTKAKEIQLSIDNGHGASEYQNKINKLISDFERYGVSAEKAKETTSSLQAAFNNMKGLSGQELISQADSFEQEFKSVKASIEQAKNSYDKFTQPVSDEKVSTLVVKIQNFLSKNTAITKKARTELEQYIDELNGKDITLKRWNDINNELSVIDGRMRSLGKLGKSLKDQFSQAATSFTQWISISSLIMTSVYKTKEALSSLKDVDTYLTEISKANDKLSKSDLARVASNSFTIASDYGKTATNYLSAVQEMSRAGYENAEEMSELSTAAQGAGSMTQELTNKYIIATDKAYKLNGSVKELTAVLDGANYITNHNAVNMSELAEGMSIVGSQAASLGVDVNEATAVLGTMIATTQQSGSEMARAFKAILLNIQQVSDADENIDAEGLTKYENACNALNVKLKETKNGIQQLRNPMAVLRDLANEYVKLDESDIRRTNLLSSVGGKLRANALNAILTQWDMYEKMLGEFSEGTGSMAVEAEKTANSWEGSLNRLANSWTKFIDSLTDQGSIINVINTISKVFSVLTNITDKIGLMTPLLTGGAITAFIKNFDHLKNLGNTQNALKSIQNVFSNTSSLSGMGKSNEIIRQLKENISDYSLEVTKAAIQQGKFTDAQIIQILKAKGLSSEEIKQTAATLSLSVSQKEATTSTLGLRTATKGLGVQLKALATAHPILLAITATLATIGIGYKIFDLLTVSVKEAKEALEESKSAFESVNDELESVNSELDTNKKRIDELNRLNKLTYLEKNELENLQAATKELERQKNILSIEQEKAATKLSKDNKIAFDKEYGDNSFSYDDVMSLESTHGDLLYSPTADINLAKEGLEGLAAALVKVQKARLEAENSGDTELINSLIERETFYKDQLKDNLKTLQDYRNNLTTITNFRKLTDEEQKFYDNLEQGLKLIYQFTDPNVWNDMEVNDVFNVEGIEKTKTELIELAQSGNLNEDILISYPKLSAAIKDLELILDEGQSPLQAFIEEITALADEAEKTSDALPIKSFSELFDNLPFDKVEELIALFKSGEVNESTISSYKELNAIMSETGLSAEDAVKELRDLSENFTLPSEMISNLQEVSDLINLLENREIDKIDTSSLEKIVKLYPEMESALSDYIIGLVNEQQLIDELKDHYDVDMKNYGNYMIAKNQSNLDFANSVGLNSAEVVNQFSNDYGIDIGNHSTYAQKKIAIEQQTLQTISDMWAKYYNAQARSLTEAGQALEDAVISGAAVNDPEAIALYNKLHEQTKIYENAVDALNNISYKGIGANFNGIKSAPGSGNSSGGSKGSNDAKPKDPTEFDWMEQKIDILDSKFTKLKTNIDSLVGYKSKNSMTNTAIDVLTEKLSVLQQMHDKYMEKAGKLGVSQEYIDKIQNGSIEIESISDENLVKVIQEYQDLYEKAESVNDEVIEVQQSIHDLNLSKLDNVINQFNQLVDIQSQMIDTENQLLELREKSGEEIYVDDYISLAEKQLNLTRQNTDAYRTLVTEMSHMNLIEGSEEWKTYNDQLQEYKNNMISAAEAIEQYKDAMTELTFKSLNDFKSKMDSINGTISTMSNLISNTNLIDDFGELTDRGLAQVALYAHQMTNAKQEVAEYAKAMETLEDALDSGLITQDEYNSMLQNYKSSQESAIKSSKEARDAILSLVKDGIQAEIDAKKKLVDETKATLDAEKDLHDYQKSITEKQTNITNLERQIAVLSNSTSRQDIAQRLQLQSQLADAKKELYETQYDHEIEQRKEALDKEYDSFEESKQKESNELDSNLDAQNAAINKYLDRVKDNYSTVYNILNQYGNEYRLSAIDDLTEPWESGSNAADICSNAINNAVANIQYDINGLDFSPLYELVELLESIGDIGIYGNGSSSTHYEDITNTGKWQKGQGDRWWFGETYREDGNYNYASNGIYTINGHQYGFDDQGYMITGWNNNDGSWKYFEPENGQMVKSTWRQDKNGDYYYLQSDGTMATNASIKAQDSSGYYIVDENGKWDGKTVIDPDLKKYPLAYKNGIRKVNESQLAWTQEEGPEAIFRPSENAILTKLKAGDGVLKGEWTKKLFDFASNPDAFLMNHIANFSLPEFTNDNAGMKVEINAPLMKIDGTLSPDMQKYVDQKCVELKNDMPVIINKSIKYSIVGK